MLPRPPFRRRLWLVAPLLLAAGWIHATAAAVAPPDQPRVSGLVEGIDLTSADALGWTPEQAQTARRYSRSSWTLGFIDPLWGLACLALLTFTGFSGRLASRIRALVGSSLASDALFVIAIVLSLAALNFPLEVYRYWRERHYGFATQDVASWFGDELKGLMIGCIMALLFLLPVWAVIRRWPRTWWIAGSAIGVALAILAIAVAPVFIAPLFNTFTPLKDEALKERILALAHREGIPAENVYEVDASRQSRHDNAYVVGLLGTQRIVLYDTLLAAYTPEEIEFVMGHEMGHYVLNHIWKGVAFAAAIIVLGFFLVHRTLDRAIARFGRRMGFDSAGSIAAVPLVLLLLSAYLFVVQPAQSGFSRAIEHQSDVFALQALGGGEPARRTGVSSFQKMAARNLSDPDPPAFIEWWLYSHPSMGNRIRFCAGR